MKDLSFARRLGALLFVVYMADVVPAALFIEPDTCGNFARLDENWMQALHIFWSMAFASNIWIEWLIQREDSSCLTYFNVTGKLHGKGDCETGHECFFFGSGVIWEQKRSKRRKNRKCKIDGAYHRYPWKGHIWYPDQYALWFRNLRQWCDFNCQVHLSQDREAQTHGVSVLLTHLVPVEPIKTLSPGSHAMPSVWALLAKQNFWSKCTKL